MSEPVSTAAVGFAAGLTLKKILAFLAAAAGSMVSLRFIKRDDQKTGPRLWWDNTSMLLSGFLVAVFVAPWTHEYFQLSDTAIPAVHFLFGLFGMSVAYQLNSRVSPLVDWIFARLGLDGGEHA